MKSVLEEPFFGEIDPNACRFPANSQYSKAEKMAGEGQDTLLQLLESREKQLFSQVSRAYMEMSGAISLEKSIAGFHLGALLMVELFIGACDA